MPYIMGVKVDNATRQEAIACLERMIRDGGQHIITTPNPEFIVAAQNDLEFRAILNQASLALPDGVGLLFAARVLGVPLKERIAGSDFIWDIARLAAVGGHTMYLLGGRGEVAAAAARELKIKNEKLKIVGVDSGPQHLTPDTYNLKPILDAAPDILLVAFGHPRQEKWIAAHLSELPSVKIAMGVGGAFDFIAGRVRRAPRLFRALGLEWLWRLLRQPWRIARIYRAVIKFSLLVIKSKFYGTL